MSQSEDPNSLLKQGVMSDNNSSSNIEVDDVEEQAGGQPQSLATAPANSYSTALLQALSESLRNINERSYTYSVIPPKDQLVTDETARTHSLWSVRCAVFCAAVNTKMLNPAFAIMCAPGADPESFPDTDPFDFNTATYFLPMCSLLGVAIASIFVGTLSDRVGRKSVMLGMAWISCAGSVVKYFTRQTFWGFCASNFAFGFFLGNLPVAMAYVGDIYTNRTKKEDELGMVVGMFVMGNAGGGILAILMGDVGLFSALWIGAIMMEASAGLTTRYMIEPGDMKLIDEDKDGLSCLEEEPAQRPKTIDKCILFNIVSGALLDNFGSTGLFPLCLSPLALQAFNFNLSDEGLEPILSVTGYQWLSAPRRRPRVRATSWPRCTCRTL